MAVTHTAKETRSLEELEYPQGMEDFHFARHKGVLKNLRVNYLPVAQCHDFRTEFVLKFSPFD